MMEFFDPRDHWRHNYHDPYEGLDDDERVLIAWLQVAIFVAAFVAAIALSAVLCP